MMIFLKDKRFKSPLANERINLWEEVAAAELVMVVSVAHYWGVAVERHEKEWA